MLMKGTGPVLFRWKDPTEDLKNRQRPTWSRVKNNFRENGEQARVFRFFAGLLWPRPARMCDWMCCGSPS